MTVFARKSIFLDFLSPENHTLYASTHNLRPGELVGLSCVSLNVGVLLCGDHCFLPPFFLLQSDEVRQAAFEKKAFMTAGVIKVPLRETSLGAFFEKKMSQYGNVKKFYPGLYESQKHSSVEEFAPSLIKRNAAVGEHIASQWEAGPDESRFWEPLRVRLTSGDIDILRGIPLKLKETGRSVTWHAIKEYLAPSVLAASFEINQTLQSEYTQIYLDEFKATIITGAPPKTTELLVASPDLSYDYYTFVGVLKALKTWDRIQEMRAEEILELKYNVGFLDFIEVFDITCKCLSDRLAVAHVFAGAYERWRQKTEARSFRRRSFAGVISRLGRGGARISEISEFLSRIALFVRARTEEDRTQYTREAGQRAQVQINYYEAQSMNIFNQQGQQVLYQYNAGRDINLDKVSDRGEFSGQLQKLLQELTRAKSGNAVSEETSNEAEERLLQAALEAKKPDADKGKLIKYLNEAKAAVEKAAAAGGLALAIAKAVELAHKLF